MSWDSVVDKNGHLEIIITRWYNKGCAREVRLNATGFEPYEPVQVEICSEDEELMVKPPWERKGE